MKKWLRGFLRVTGVLSIATACAPAVSVQQPAVLAKKGQEPSIGDVSMANVGAVMFTEYNYSETAVIRLDDPVSETFGLGARLQAPDGTLLHGATVSGRPAYCTATPTFAMPLEDFSRSVCFFDTDQDGLLDEYWIQGTIESTSRKIPAPAKYVSAQTTDNGAGGFKKDLIYQGMQADTLRVSYREYIDDMARPAFAQDLTYNMEEAKPTIVVFQNVRMEVLSANNSEVKYRVLHGY